MLVHLTLPDIIFWVAIIALQICILKLSWAQFKSLTIAMIFLLAESAILIVLKAISERLYSKMYYAFSAFECVILASVSIEFSMLLLPQAKKLIRSIGPAVIGVPTFCAGVIFFPLKINLAEFMTNALRVGQVAFILSIALLFFSFAFEDTEVKESKLARSYSVFLGLLAICAECQLRLDIVGNKVLDPSVLAIVVHNIWPVAWIVGLGLVARSLKQLKAVEIHNLVGEN